MAFCFKSLSISILWCCLVNVGAKSKFTLSVIDDNSKLPNYAGLLHSFSKTERSQLLRTQTTISSVQFYALFLDESLNLKTDSVVHIEFNNAACYGLPTYMVVQFGECTWQLNLSFTQGWCALNMDNTTLAWTNNAKVLSPALPYSNCTPNPIKTVVSNFPGVTEMKRVNVKVQTFRGNSGAVLVLANAYYGYPKNNTEIFIAIIFGVLLIMTIILIAASAFVVRFHRLFLRFKPATNSPAFLTPLILAKTVANK